MTLAFSAGDAAYWGLAIFLVLLGVGSLFALVKLGLMFDKVSSLVGGAERDALPVVVKAGGTVDRVNYQLDKIESGRQMERYQVMTCGEESICDCADMFYRGGSVDAATGRKYACKHVRSLICLKNLGKIPA